MGGTPAMFDMSQAKPIGGGAPLFDMSKAQPIQQQAPPAKQAEPEGFWHSLGAQFGLTPEAADAAAKDFKDHPIISTLKASLGPAGPLVKGLYDQGKLSIGEVAQAVKDASQGNGAGALVHGIQAVPIVGPAMNKAAQQAPVVQGDLSKPMQYLSDVGQVATNPGAMGTLTGAAINAAPIVAGAVEKVPIADAALSKVAAPVQAGVDAVGSSARSAVSATGQAAEDAGIGLMNKTVGTLKSDFKRGANPARGYFDTGNGPSLTMGSIADKAATSLDTVGKALGDAYKGATDKGVLIPFDTVAEKMAAPIQKAIDLETGPGGTGNLAAIKGYVDQFEPTFAKAQAAGGFTPSELFDIKRSIAQNTNWSDPTQFNLKSVRQQQAGALSGILSDAVPETTQLNQNYQDLTKLVDRAEERANTGSRPLTAHIYKAGGTVLGAAAGAMDGHAVLGAAAGAALDSVPFKTTLASGLVKGGRALQSFAAPSEAASMEGVTAGDMPTDQTNGKNGNPQGTPPRLGNGSTTGPDAWVNAGAEKVAVHVAQDPTSGISKSDIANAAQTAKGRSLLIKASDLTPGSAAMKNLVVQLKGVTQ